VGGEYGPDCPGRNVGANALLDARGDPSFRLFVCERDISKFAPFLEQAGAAIRPIEIYALRKVSKVIFRYTQIACYLRCPRSYRYRYLDGWREKETRAAMAFGRCFEKALAAYENPKRQSLQERSDAIGPECI
jgi:hypothetical protein